MYRSGDLFSYNFLPNVGTYSDDRKAEDLVEKSLIGSAFSDNDQIFSDDEASSQYLNSIASEMFQLKPVPMTLFGFELGEKENPTLKNLSRDREDLVTKIDKLNDAKAKDQDEAKALIRQKVIEDDGFIEARIDDTVSHAPKIDYAVQLTSEGEPIL